MMERKSKIILNYTFVMFLFFVTLVGCTTYQLERRLRPDIRGWYENHAVFMDTQSPKWIDEQQRTERILFLSAPEEFQRYYMKNLFWQVRVEGLKDLFNERLGYINRNIDPSYNFKEPQTIVLLCGIPDHIEFIYQNELIMEPASNLFTQPDTYQCWYYFLISQGITRPTYVFKFNGLNWTREVNVLGQGSDAEHLERYWRKQFAPTEQGWIILASEWLDFKKGKKNEK